MAFKTMLRQLISKWGVMSIDLQTAFEADTVSENDSVYLQAQADELPETPHYNPQESDTGAPAEKPGEEQVNLDDL